MTHDPAPVPDLTRTVLALTLMSLLAAASFWVLRPFLMAMVWAVMIVVTTWQPMLRLQARLKGRRTAAASLMTLLLLLVLVIPSSLAVASLASHSAGITAWIRSLATVPWPPPPAWLKGVPLAGAKLTAQWQHVLDIGPEGVSAWLAPYAGRALDRVLATAGSIGMMVAQFLLTLFIAAILYLRGEQAAAWMDRFARRIAGEHGERSLTLAAQAIRAVALGVVGTAVIQTVLAGLGLAVCGIPGAALLTAVAFVCCLAQIGSLPVLVLAVLWLFWTGQQGWAIALAAWTLVVTALASVISPLLMKKAVDLPMLLVFAGVTGGLMAFGIVGLFIGPLALAIAYSLLDGWVLAG